MNRKQVYFVTFPRSGHHALIKFLNQMAEISSEYCEFYKCRKSTGERHECLYEERHWASKNHQCGSGKRLLKNHDFDLKLPIKDEALYIIQYRHPFMAIRSWYELDLAGNYNIPEWDIYLQEKLTFWLSFVRKWVPGNLQKKNFYFIQYEDLGDREKLEDIAKFIGVDVKQQLESGYFSKKRALHYADHNEISKLRRYEEKIAPALKVAGIDRLFNDTDKP